MKIREQNNLIILLPSDNYKYISNGSVWSTKVFLGKNDSIENWYDTNENPIEIKSDNEVIE